MRTSTVHRRLKNLHRHIATKLARSNCFFYAAEGGIKASEGMGPVVIMGFRPSTDLWKEDAPSRRLLYGAINAHSLGDAYLTDCIKERSKVKDDTKNYDLPWNLSVLSQELEIVRPEVIITLGTKAELFLYQHNFAHRYGIVAAYHFGIVHNWAYRWDSREQSEQAFKDDFAKAVECYRTWKTNGWC